MDYLQYIKEQQLLPEDSLEFLQLQSYLQRFQNDRYGEGHVLFGAIAAFPVFLTTELLYKLWLNFQRYREETGVQQQIHRIAVSDLLLSGLLREVAIDIYEMRPPIRTALLGCLEQRFRGKRNILQELAEFMLYYVRSYQLEGESVTTAVREAQEWNALAYVDPGAAVRQIRKALSGSIEAGSPTRQLRINLLLQRLDEQYSRTNAGTAQLDAFRTLVDYSQGMSEFFRGNHGEALQRFRNLEQRAPQSRGAGAGLKQVKMPIPKAIYESLQRPAPSKETEREGNVFALFAGIDQYPNLPQLQGSTRDAREMAQLVGRLIPEERLHSDTLLDAGVHQNLVLENLQHLLRKATPHDVVLFYFAGHGENHRQGAAHNTLLFFDYHPEGNQEESITDEAFRLLVETHAVNDPSIVVILDTHAGSDRWLDHQNEKHLVLSACGEEEMAYESEGAGAFTQLLLEKLDAKNGAVTYQQLLGEIRRDILPKYPQLPQLLATENASLRLFLRNRSSVVPRIQELLREAGYYEGPVSEETQPAAEEAMQRFIDDWQVEGDPLKAVQQKILADQRSELRVLVVTGSSSSPLSQALTGLFDSLSFPVQAATFSLLPSRQSSVQLSQHQEEDPPEATARRVDEADFVVFLIDDILIRSEQSPALVRRILQWRQTGLLPVVPLVVQKCDWEQHAVAGLPGMERYRMKGNFLEPEWITTTGIAIIREELEGIGRFMIPPEQRTYQKLCERFDPALSDRELQPLKEKLRKAAAELTNIDFAVQWLNPETSQKYLFGAFCALADHPDGIDHFQKLEDLLRWILDQQRLAGMQMSVLFQLAQTFDGMLERNEQQSRAVITEPGRKSLRKLLYQLLKSEQVQADKAARGENSLCAFLYGMIDRITRSLGSNLANYCFEKGLLSEALSLNQLQSKGVALPTPEKASLTYLKTSEQFDGLMAVRPMDQLGNKLFTQAQSISDFAFLVERLRPALFQGYIFGAAKGIEAHPEARYFGPLLGFLDRIAQSKDLNYDNLRLRVLYRLIMGLEAIIDRDNGRTPPEITSWEREKATEILQHMRINQRTEADTQKHKGGGIGNRIELVLEKLPIAKEEQRGSAAPESSKEAIRHALFQLGFTPQLGAARKIDISPQVIPVILPVPPAAGPGLLRDRLCSEFALPPETVIKLSINEMAAYGFNERVLLQIILDEFRLEGKPDLDNFAELMTGRSSHAEVVVALENHRQLSDKQLRSFTLDLFDFSDRLARALREQRSAGGLRTIWLMLAVDKLPADVPPKVSYNWYVDPVVLPPVERIGREELEGWTEQLPEQYLEVILGEFLPRYKPMYPLALIRELCRELEVENIYQSYFARYEILKSEE